MTGRVGWLAGTSKPKGGLKDALDYSCDSTCALAARVGRAHRRRVDSPSARRGARHLRHQPLDGTPNRLKAAQTFAHYQNTSTVKRRCFRMEAAPLHYQLTPTALRNVSPG